MHTTDAILDVDGQTTLANVLYDIARDLPMFADRYDTDDTTVLVVLLQVEAAIVKHDIDDVLAWSPKTAARNADENYREELRLYGEVRAEFDAAMNNLGKLIAEAYAFRPPSNQHVDLKNQAIMRLHETLHRYLEREPQEPVRLDGETYRSKLLDDLYNLRRLYAKEIRRAKVKLKRNIKWTEALRQSLNDDPAAMNIMTQATS